MRPLRAAVLALFLVVPASAAGPELVDIVPANALQFIGINDIKNFSEKLDRVIVGVDPTQQGVGVFWGVVVNQFGLGTALDRNAPLGLVMANPQEVLGKALDPNQNPDEMGKLVVGSLGYLDEAKLAQDLKIDPQTLQPEKVFAFKNPTFPTPMKGLYSKGRFYLGIDEKALLSVSKAPRLRDSLSKEQVEILRRCDLLFLVNAEAVSDPWKQAVTFLQGQAPPLRELLGHLNDLRHVTVGVRLEEGIEAHALAQFRDKSPAAGLLEKLNRGKASTLSGLPTREELLFAQAGAGSLASLAEHPAVPAVLQALLKSIQGNRLALYATTQSQAGQFAGLLVLDCEDPATLLAALAGQIPAGKPGELKFATPAPVLTRATLEQFIRDLGSEDFDTREKAAVRLLQAGRPALELLEQATRSADLEIARRSRELVQEIRTGAAGTRIDLLSGRNTLAAAPTLVYHPDVEKRGDSPVSVVQIRLDPQDAGLAPRLRELFGPDWDKVRLVRRERQVVVLLGSDTPLLEESLKLLSQPGAGLPGAPALKDFHTRTDPGRRLEVHASYVRLLTLLDIKMDRLFKEEERKGTLSAALSTQAGRVRLDLWLPLTELRGMVRQAQQGGN